LSARSASGSRQENRTALTLDKVVDATLALIDEKGVGSASMRAIAKRLNVEAQSLYTYVDSRDELFDAVVGHVVDELDDDPAVTWAPGEPWRTYLSGLARGVRGYARRHPHAFPLLATRPSEAPWVNPPLRSLRWIEAFLANLEASGFTDDQVLFAYRSFNSFLLGFLLLETGAMTVDDPKPGDGSFASRSRGSSSGDSRQPVPGQVTPTRTLAETRARRQAGTAQSRVNPVGDVDPEQYPTVHRFAEALAYEHYEDEFSSGLENMLDRVDAYLAAT
jgi:TetR/AcrR family transcriptional regulator, tetracycline repressor protein